MKNKLLIFSFVTISFLVSSCGIYSFTGTTLSSDLESIYIENFSMATAGAPQNISLTFNENLKEYYQRNTSLKIVPNDGDLILSGAITKYEMTPLATTAGDKAAMNRLTIGIDVSFYNSQNQADNFDKEFSFYADFSQEQSLSDVEPTLVPKILDQIVLDIFNATAAQW